MAKLVLTHKSASRYDDEPGEKYHFPRSYLRFVERGLNDYCLYYEPRRGGRASYVAIAFITAITPDPVVADHYYAWISGYQELVQPVPFREGEAALLKPDGTINKGQFGRSVRAISEAEFNRVLELGFARLLDRAASALEVDGVEEITTHFDRPIVEIVTRRPFRDRAFAQQVRDAYAATCALTGIQLINGGGASEAEAAHIKPVQANGPDSVRNGLSLSRTVHWLFDRGIVALDDNYRILRAERHLPESFGRILNTSGYAAVPPPEALRPHPAFLRWHREHVFKG